MDFRLSPGGRGRPDAVIDNDTGLLVDPRDTLAVAEAVTSILSDRELA